MLCAVVVALVLSVNGAFATKPGFQARITQHALDYASQQAIDSLAALVSKTKIPDQSGSSGHLSYSFTSIHIEGFTKPSSRIRLVPSVGLSWTADNAGVHLHSDWHARYKRGWFKISVSGSVDVSVEDINFSVTMAIGADSSGRPSIKSGGCSCSIGRVKIDIHGDLHQILNLFRGLVEKRVRSLLPDKLCDAVNDQINNQAERQLEKVKVMTPLMDRLFMLDYRLVAPPSFQEAYMETYHKGEITWTKDPRPPPFPVPSLPPYPSSSNMLYLWVGEYIPQSFVYAAQKHGFLTYNLTTKDLPPDQRGFLNTTCTLTCVGMLVPEIAKRYPGQTVVLRMNSTTVPQVNMSPNLLEAKLAGDIAIYVDNPGGPSPYLLTLHVSAAFNMTATITTQLIKGSVTGSSFKVTVVDSKVGPVKSKLINTMVGFAMKLFIIPKLNEQGNHGFPLPVTDNVKFTNTQLQIQQNALMIGTDLLYNFNF